MLFANWAFLLFLGVASAMPLVNEVETTDGQAANLARSADDSSAALLITRDPAETTLKGKKIKQYGHYAFYIVATNWDSSWFGAEHSTKKDRVLAIYEAVKKYATSQKRKDMMSGAGGANFKKMEGRPDSVLYSIGCTGVKDTKDAELMRGFIEHVLVAQTKTPVTMPNKKDEAAAIAAESALESSSE